MNKTLFFLPVALTVLYLFNTGGVAAGTRSDESPLRVITLATPDHRKHIEYLGLKWGPAG